MCSSFVMPLCSRLWFSGAQNKPELIPPGRCLLSRWRNCLFVRKKSFEKLWHLSRRSSDHIHTLLLVNTDFLKEFQTDNSRSQFDTLERQMAKFGCRPASPWFVGFLGTNWVKNVRQLFEIGCSRRAFDCMQCQVTLVQKGTGLGWCAICEKKAFLVHWTFLIEEENVK